MTAWGSYGSGDGQLYSPFAVTLGSGGTIFVADRNNSRIQMFTSSGIFLTKWGSLGMGNGQFQYPGGVGVDSVGNVYVADTINNRIYGSLTANKPGLKPVILWRCLRTSRHGNRR